MALQSLKKYFESTNREDFIQLLKLPCVITEKVQASSIHVLSTTEGYKFFKSGQKQELNKIDRTIHRYYENGIKYFESLSLDVKAQLPLDWKFGFDYMVSEQSVDIKYQRIPKNGLMLTHIQVLNPADNTLIKRVVRDPKILNEWADLLGVQRPQVIFNGMLSSNQKDQLVRLLEMSDIEYARTFESESFTRRVYNIFNDSLNRTALNEDLDGEIDSLVINFFDGKGGKNFKIQKNYNKIEEERKPSDTYQIALLDLVEFFSEYNLESVSLQSERADERYLELISNAFNAYISKNAAKYAGVNFDSADFNDRPEFSLNTKFIMNEKTIELVNNSVISELYKIALGSFRRKRVKETQIINNDLMEQINKVIDEIDAIVMLKSNESNVMAFNTFLNHQRLKGQDSPIIESIMTFSQFLENKDI
jgi:hypothetical protein